VAVHLTVHLNHLTDVAGQRSCKSVATLTGVQSSGQNIVIAAAHALLCCTPYGCASCEPTHLELATRDGKAINKPQNPQYFLVFLTRCGSKLLQHNRLHLWSEFLQDLVHLRLKNVNLEPENPAVKLSARKVSVNACSLWAGCSKLTYLQATGLVASGVCAGRNRHVLLVLVAYYYCAAK
jgi:hypothetical protein